MSEKFEFNIKEETKERGLKELLNDYLFLEDKKDTFSEYCKINNVELTNENVKSAYFDKIVSHLKEGRSYKVKRFLNSKESFGINEEDIQDNEKIKSAYFSGLVYCLKEGENYSAKDLLDNQKSFGINEKDIRANREKIKSACLNCLISYLEKGRINSIDDILNSKESFGINEKDIQNNKNVKSAYFSGLVYCLKKGGDYNAKGLLNRKESFGINEEDIQNNEKIKSAYFSGLVSYLKEGRIGSIDIDLLRIQVFFDSKELFGINEEDIQNNEKIKLTYLDGLVYCLKEGQTIDVKRALDNRKLFGINEKDIQNNKNVKSAYFSSLISYLKEGWIRRIEDLLSYKESFGINEKDIQNNKNVKSAYFDKIVSHLKKGEDYNAQGLLNRKESFGINEEDIQNNEKIKSAYFDGIISCLEEGQIYKARGLLSDKELFGINEKDIQGNREKIKSACFSGLVFFLKEGQIYNAKKLLNIKESFGIDGKDIQDEYKIKSAYLSSLVFCLEERQGVSIENLLDDKELFGINEEDIQNNEKIKSACFNSLVFYLKNEWISEVKYFLYYYKELFGINEKRIKYEIIEIYKDKLDPYVKLINKEISGKKIDLLSVSLERLLMLLTIKEHFLISELENNSFLFEAVNQNSRFGHKLLAHYKQYDSVSQEKAQFVFDEESKTEKKGLELRKEMQEKLKDFMNNKSIVKKLEEEKINTELWLNYDKEKTFQLKDKDAETRKSFLIEVPLNRILTDSINNYLSRLEFLKESFDDIEIKNPKRIKIQENLKDAKSEKAKQYIQKQLEAQPEKIKVEFYLEEIIQDIQNNKEKIEELNENLKGKEKENADFKEIKRIMSKMEGQCGSLDEKIKNLSSKIDYLKNQIPLRKEYIQQHFSQGRENIDNHIENDFKSLDGVFSKKESKFHNRELTIKVWDRNPHVDAYLGNYMGCCISVENQPTIFDYLTDLGFQVVTMVDKKTKIPVAAAWCWLGKNEVTNRTYLVIDNIEANTDYSSKFSKIMWKEIISYIKDYSEKIWVDIVVMGDSYNDLEPEEGSQEHKELIFLAPFLEKIGGFNGRKYYMDYEEYDDEDDYLNYGHGFHPW